MKQQDNKLIEAALEANRERRLWKFMAHLSLIGAVASTIGFIIVVKGAI